MIVSFETATTVIHNIPTKEERNIMNELEQHLVLVYDKDDNEELCYYIVYAIDWYFARKQVVKHFYKNFPTSSKKYNWTTDSIKID